MKRPAAYIFDVFGTLVDWRSGVASYCKERLEAKGSDFNPTVFADLWRGQYQPAMQRIRAGSRGYVPLDILHRENLDRVLSNTGLAPLFDENERDDLNRAWEHLPPWPEVPDAMRRLRAHGFVASCSNGSVALMIRLSRYGNLQWDTILGAETARDYKPKPAVYLASCRALGLEAGNVMMVAAHNDDLFAAREAGLMTGFFPRPTEHGEGQNKDLEPASNWDFSGPDLQALAAFVEQNATQM